MADDVVTPNNPNPKSLRADVIAQAPRPKNPLQQYLAKVSQVPVRVVPVKKPHKNASTEAWIEYAKAEDGKKIESMHRSDLIKRFG